MCVGKRVGVRSGLLFQGRAPALVYAAFHSSDRTSSLPSLPLTGSFDSRVDDFQAKLTSCEECEDGESVDSERRETWTHAH